MAMYQYLLTGTVLLICSVTDLKCRRICKAAIGGYIILALLGHTAGRTAIPAKLAAGLLPGIFCFLISWVSRQGLGYGDSALVAGCGLSVGLWPCISVLLTAFLASGLWAAGLLVFRRAGRKKEIPFVPFLLFGLAVFWCGTAGRQ